MHIPDNYLSPATCVVMGAAMIPVWKKAADKVKKEVTREKLPLLGVASAFSFLIMMFNVPLPGGTTGHAVGASLITLLLGPWSAVISVSVALALQALIFGDGGVLAIGANTFNMAFVMPFVTYYIYNLIKGKKDNNSINYVAAFVAGYIGLNTAALLTAIEFGIQPMLYKDAAGMPIYCPYPLNVSIPAMLIPHMLVAGVIEGVVTASVLAYVKKLSPEIIYKNEGFKIKPLHAMIVAMIGLSPIGLLAVGTAWGEWGADEIEGIIGYIPRAIGNGFSFEAIIPDYAVTGIPEILGYILSAALGTAIIICLFQLFKKLCTKAVDAETK